MTFKMNNDPQFALSNLTGLAPEFYTDQSFEKKNPNTLKYKYRHPYQFIALLIFKVRMFSQCYLRKNQTEVKCI